MALMETQMLDAYADLQVIIYVSAIGGYLCAIWAVYLIFIKSQATQMQYLQFWGATMLVLLITVIILCMFVTKMSRRYNKNRALLLGVKACITEPKW
jgi:NADH:ubiquinone oxidoreductase subunit 6 (subunit J)